MLELDDWLPHAGSRPLVRLQTEPHVWRRLRGPINDAQCVDISDCLSVSGLAQRRGAISEARRRIDHAEIPQDAVIIFDTSEGWLTTNISYHLRRSRPGAIQVGLQHGRFGLEGRQSKWWIRRLRRTLTPVLGRLIGFSPVGAGFGNLNMDSYVLMGERYARYIRVLQPEVPLRVDLGALFGLPAAHQLDGDAEVLVLGQDISSYTPGAVSIIAQVRERLEILASEGHRIVVRPHPKSPDRQWDCGGDVEMMNPETPMTDVMGPLTVIVSFFSTGLLEAAYLGCPIVSLHHRDLPLTAYEDFVDLISVDDFVLDWNVDRFSKVRDGSW